MFPVHQKQPPLSNQSNDDKYDKAYRAKRDQVLGNLQQRWPAVISILAFILLLVLFQLPTGSRHPLGTDHGSNEMNTTGPNIKPTSDGLVSTGRKVDTDNDDGIRIVLDRFRRPLTITLPLLQPEATPPPTQQKDSQQQQIQTFNFHVQEERRRAVVEAFKHSWAGYKKYAYGRDTLLPTSQKGEDWFGMGLTLLDGLDTAYLMGLTDVVAECRQFIEKDLKFNHPGSSNVFEVTIRVLGVLLTMYHFTGDMLYLDRAKELTDKMLPAFQTDNGVPYASIDFSQGIAVPAYDIGSSTSEATTLQLEWRDLAMATGETKYWKVVEKVMDVVFEDKTQPGRVHGLVPIYMSTSRSGNLFLGSNYRLGSRGDSYYEYLTKQWLQTGKTENRYKRMFEESMDGILKKMVRRSEPSGYLYVGELQGGTGGDLTPKMDHLVCFLPGTVLLHISEGRPLTAEDIRTKLTQKFQAYLKFAEELMYTCYRMYKDMATGISPELVFFNIGKNNGIRDIIVRGADAHNLLRPETVESLFYFYRLTGNQTYRDWGWEIFQSFEKYSKVENGYTCLQDVTKIPPEKRDKMESFWVGETLKYLYLLFDDDSKLPLDRYVLNTEAHPLPIASPIDAGFRQKLSDEHLGHFSNS